MFGGRNHDIVGDSSRQCTFEEAIVCDIVGLDLVNRELFVAYSIHIEINTAIVV